MTERFRGDKAGPKLQEYGNTHSLGLGTQIVQNPVRGSCLPGAQLLSQTLLCNSVHFAGREVFGTRLLPRLLEQGLSHANHLFNEQVASLSQFLKLTQVQTHLRDTAGLVPATEIKQALQYSEL